MKKEFSVIRKTIGNYDAKREELIKKSRELLKISKQIIYSIHRENITEAKKNIVIAKKIKKELEKIILFNKKLSYEGSYSDGCQEYVEGLCYFEFVKNNKIPTLKSLNISAEDYLMGICDLTGELVRRAVRLATKRQINEVDKIKIFVEDLFEEFLKFDFRNGNLRKKYDSIKWNLKKLEEILYDIKLKK
jgi:predicted translin family RNA/ssDNA-binding protein